MDVRAVRRLTGGRNRLMLDLGDEARLAPAGPTAWKLFEGSVGRDPAMKRIGL